MVEPSLENKKEGGEKFPNQETLEDEEPTEDMIFPAHGIFHSIRYKDFSFGTSQIMDIADFLELSEKALDICIKFDKKTELKNYA